MPVLRFASLVWQVLNWSCAYCATSRVASMITRYQLSASNLFPCHTCISEP